jgi:hypothetical protein
MINGVDLFFIIPPVILVIVAVVVGLWRLSRHGAKRALMSVVRVIVYGSFILFGLLILFTAMYYAGGGH